MSDTGTKIISLSAIFTAVTFVMDPIISSFMAFHPVGLKLSAQIASFLGFSSGAAAETMSAVTAAGGALPILAP